MKLSEAIRIGAKIRPQCKVHMFRNGMSCAAGAAIEGAGLRRDVFNSLGLKWPWVYEQKNLCPVCHREDLAFIILSAHLNDGLHGTSYTEGWTRERIADWVETIEPKEEA